MIAIDEIFSMAVTSIKKNKTRSLLTTLGIVIGVSAVIAAFAVGQGANKAIDEQIAAFGSNFLMIYSQRSGRSSQGNIRYLTLDDAEAIERSVSGIDEIAPVINAAVTVVYGNTNWTTVAAGSTASFSYVQKWEIESGRDLYDTDVRQGTKVAIIGKTIAKKLFDDQNPVGKSIRINKIPFTVIGVFARKGQSMSGTDLDDIIIVPITTAQKRLIRMYGTVKRVQYIYIQGVSMEALDYIQSETILLMRERHKIKPGESDDFAVHNVTQMLNARRQASTIMTMLLGCIAVISLIVGGIGIMNIMLVSVTERTREIGIRMAVGAKKADIRLQFLIEAMVLSDIGGLIGILCGMLGGKALSVLAKVKPVFSVGSILLAFVFSCLVGIGFGFYPAYKGSLLHPIDALKHE